MEKVKHTPGPWTFSPNVGKRPEWEYIGANDPRDGSGRTSICMVCQSQAQRKTARLISNKEMEANARLIAAGPELVEALRATLAILDRAYECGDRTEKIVIAVRIDRALTAIAKAEGR